MLVLLVCGCSFSAAIDSADAPVPSDPRVRILAVRSSTSTLHPGQYGIPVDVEVENGLGAEITDLTVTLAVTSGATDRGNGFRWRDADRRESVMPQAATIPAGARLTYHFIVDALPSLALPGMFVVDAGGTFHDGDRAGSITPADTKLQLDFASDVKAPIVVNEQNDELDGDSKTSFREALVRAETSPGFDRIVFDPTVFPPDTLKRITIENIGGNALPPIASDLVIDGGGSQVVLTPDVGDFGSSQVYLLEHVAGSLVIANLGFDNTMTAYPVIDLTADGCAGGSFGGGAILNIAGPLVLDSNTFTEPANAPERNCFAATVRIAGGSDHRILNNQFTNTVGDAVDLQTPARAQFLDNFVRGRSTAVSDDCIVVNNGAGERWIVGNVCMDIETSGVLLLGAGGKTHIVHNTFVRIANNAAARRLNNGAVELRNNIYVTVRPAVLAFDTFATPVDIDYEVVSDGTLCEPAQCPALAPQQAMVTVADPGMLGFPANVTALEDLLPAANSAAVDSGVDGLDRNGKLPHRFNGAAPDRGALER